MVDLLILVTLGGGDEENSLVERVSQTDGSGKAASQRSNGDRVGDDLAVDHEAPIRREANLNDSSSGPTGRGLIKIDDRRSVWVNDADLRGFRWRRWCIAQD